MARTHTPSGSAMPVSIRLEDIALHGDMQIPENARGLVIFVHGSGSSRFSPRNRQVAAALNKRGLATLLLDLLTEEEQKIDSETMELRFDIPLLAGRSTRVATWALGQVDLQGLPLGLFGASTGAAAALMTAAALKGKIAAVVSRGGRPDLAEAALDKVEAPTLLIVGGDDDTVLELNRKAARLMRCKNEVHVVPGATHLFEESGALEEVARVAGAWFTEHLKPAVELKRAASA